MRFSVASFLLTTAALAGCDVAVLFHEHADCGTDCAISPHDGATDARDVTHDVTDPTQLYFASVQIHPRDVMVTSTDGSMPTVPFTVTATRRNGEIVSAVPGLWSLTSGTVGTIDTAGGTFLSNGVVGGSTGVHVDVPSGDGVTTLSDETTVLVEINRTILVGATPSTAPAQFAAVHGVADPANDAQTVYPLDQAWMPNNVAAPDVQWLRGTIGDLFRVTVAKPYVSVVAYVSYDAATFTFDWHVDAAAWQSLLQSAPDAPAVFTVDRLWNHGTSLAVGAQITVHLAHGSVFGSVYYWDLGNGRIRRLNAVTASREDFMPDPPMSPAGGRHCVACHSVSSDGRYLAGQLGEGGGQRGTVFDLTTNLTGTPAASVFPPSAVSFGPSSFSPDSTRLVVSSLPGLGMVDPVHGTMVAATGLPATNANHPSWAPDNSAIAYIASNQQYSWAFTSGDLALIAQTAPDVFGAATTVHHALDLASQPEGAGADMHPTWSPDSRYLAFAHGASNAAAATTGALYLLPRAGGTATRLVTTLSNTDGAHSFWPTFSPFITSEPTGGRTYWLAFYDKRDYGNTQVGTRGTSRRQLWVTAINTNVTAGADPSAVPYWLPGQDTAQENIAAYWAPVACRATGAVCGTSSECCSGQCLPDPAHPAQSICQPPPTAMCRAQGQTCGGSGDCCSGLVCAGNQCVPPAPG